MLKLLVMLVTFLGVGLALLSLRQLRWELNAESVKIYAHIREHSETLLDQRVAIARNTNPWALNASLKNNGINTGSALERRGTQVGKPVPSIESDLIAPLRQ